MEKYLAGTCTPQEKAIMEEWFEQGGNYNKPGLEINEASRAQLLSKIHEVQNQQVVSDKSKVRILFTGWRAAAVWTGLLITAGIASGKQVYSNIVQ